jgi:hypothetical protein
MYKIPQQPTLAYYLYECCLNVIYTKKRKPTNSVTIELFQRLTLSNLLGSFKEHSTIRTLHKAQIEHNVSIATGDIERTVPTDDKQLQFIF